MDDQLGCNIPNLKKRKKNGTGIEYLVAITVLPKGVTFDELSSVEALLQKENLEQSQKETAIAIVQKLQGTELFSLLKNFIEGVSRRIT